MRKRIAPMSSGFTLVELVMVIILIGVLSALGVGLFASRSAFSPLLATQQLASATLLAQQAALAGNPSNSLSIAQSAEHFRFTVGARTFELPRTGNNIEFTFTGDSTFESCLSSLGAVYRGSCQP